MTRRLLCSLTWLAAASANHVDLELRRVPVPLSRHYRKCSCLSVCDRLHGILPGIRYR